MVNSSYERRSSAQICVLLLTFSLIFTGCAGERNARIQRDWNLQEGEFDEQAILLIPLANGRRVAVIRDPGQALPNTVLVCVGEFGHQLLSYEVEWRFGKPEFNYEGETEWEIGKKVGVSWTDLNADGWFDTMIDLSTGHGGHIRIGEEWVKAKARKGLLDVFVTLEGGLHYRFDANSGQWEQAP